MPVKPVYLFVAAHRRIPDEQRTLYVQDARRIAGGERHIGLGAIQGLSCVPRLPRRMRLYRKIRGPTDHEFN